ncbi:hypothetical protein PR001_g32461 [Phytophthora rubi]|uniref:Uncharacterized protein n=1 Tax=Phytophthora rubi TaxID=129364 RepID=A0A6A3GCF4_9STRA|nr:hypothetical protein PR001_g32461 [Phytophthora rubi]KAE8954540.1 hypothetical protein PR002_g32058 [Phytophthora rubi]
MGLAKEAVYLVAVPYAISVHGGVAQTETKPHAASSICGFTLTLTNTILGSDTLAIPFASASSGCLLDNAIMFVIAMITRYWVRLLQPTGDRASNKGNLPRHPLRCLPWVR